jgi:hypothetical protein
MKVVRLAAVLAVVGMVSAGCSITAQQAQQVSLQALDAACANFSTINVFFASYAESPTAKKSVVSAARAGLLTLKSACDQRPLDNNPALIRTGLAAVASIAAAELAARN